jgi:two-component system, NarL family, response regulator LiaR
MNADRVLVVDDNRDFAELLEQLLIGQNVSVVGIAATGQEACEMTESLKPSLVFMDFNMPDMDGLAACERVKANSPESRVIVISAHSRQPRPELPLWKITDGFFPKEALIESLMTVIRAG